MEKALKNKTNKLEGIFVTHITGKRLNCLM